MRKMMRELILWMTIRTLGLAVWMLLKASRLLERASENLARRLLPLLNTLRKGDPS